MIINNLKIPVYRDLKEAVTAILAIKS